MPKLSKEQLGSMQDSRNINESDITSMKSHTSHHTPLHVNLMIRSMSLGLPFVEAHKRAQDSVGN